MIYANDKIQIRPMTERDFTPEYEALFHDDRVTAHNSHGLFRYRRPEVLQDESKLVWAILFSDELMGSCCLQSISWVHRSAEFAIVINAAYHGKGIGTQCLRWILHHAFTRLGLNRVWSGTSAENIGMWEVFNKVGMVEEGRFRDGMWNRGRFVDVITYGILAREWQHKTEDRSE